MPATYERASGRASTSGQTEQSCLFSQVLAISIGLQPYSPGGGPHCQGGSRRSHPGAYPRALSIPVPYQSNRSNSQAASTWEWRLIVDLSTPPDHSVTMTPLPQRCQGCDTPQCWTQQLRSETSAQAHLWQR